MTRVGISVEGTEVRRHAVDGSHRAQARDVFVRPPVAHHTDGFQLQICSPHERSDMRE
jgi:hypothetical protein